MKLYISIVLDQTRKSLLVSDYASSREGLKNPGFVVCFDEDSSMYKKILVWDEIKEWLFDQGFTLVESHDLCITLYNNIYLISRELLRASRQTTRSTQY